MRLAYLSAAEIPSRFANSVQVMKMCTAFANRGHDVILFARKGSEPAADPFAFYGCQQRFQLNTLTGPQVGLLGMLGHPLKAAASQIWANGPPDLIYARHVFSLAAVAPFGFPMIFEAHVLPRYAIERHIQAWVFRRKSFRRLVTISDALRRDYHALFPWLPEDRTVVAHDGADLPDITGERSAVRRKRIRVGYVGNLFPGKGMEIVAALAERMPDTEFHVVGGSDADLRLWKSRVDFSNLRFHGFVPHGELQALYRDFEVVLEDLAVIAFAILCSAVVSKSADREKERPAPNRRHPPACLVPGETFTFSDI